jgi:hypothetical protein
VTSKSDHDGFLGLELPLYHTTGPHIYQQIADEGFTASHKSAGHRKMVREDIEETAAETGIGFPIKRHKCVFFYPFFENVRDRTGTESDDWFLGPEAIITVEGDRIDSDIYVADYHMFDCAYHLTWQPSPDSTMQVDSREEAIRSYLKSVTKVESRSDLEAACSDTVMPEVLIEEPIEPDCIREVVFKKELQCGGGLPVLASNYRRKWPLDPSHIISRYPLTDGLLSAL